MALTRPANLNLPGFPDCMWLKENGRCIQLGIAQCRGRSCQIMRRRNGADAAGKPAEERLPQPLQRKRPPYKTGDFIIYGIESVCRVEAIGVPDIPGIDGGRQYYTLSSLYRDEKVFTPIDTTVFMRPVINRAEALEIIRQIPGIEAEIDEHRDIRYQADYYQALLQSHECADMIRIIATVNMKRNSARESGSKVSQTDSRYKRQAEECLEEEFAVALGIPKAEVRAYIEGMLRQSGPGREQGRDGDER